MKKPNAKTRTAIVYVRTASGEHTDRGSLKHQQSVCEGYCEQGGIKVLKVFADEGTSGMDFYRPGLVEAIRYCRNNDVAELVVSDISRIGGSSLVIEVVQQALSASQTVLTAAVFDAASLLDLD